MSVETSSLNGGDYLPHRGGYASHYERTRDRIEVVAYGGRVMTGTLAEVPRKSPVYATNHKKKTVEVRTEAGKKPPKVLGTRHYDQLQMGQLKPVEGEEGRASFVELALLRGESGKRHIVSADVGTTVTKGERDHHYLLLDLGEDMGYRAVQTRRFQGVVPGHVSDHTKLEVISGLELLQQQYEQSQIESPNKQLGSPVYDISKKEFEAAYQKQISS